MTHHHLQMLDQLEIKHFSLVYEEIYIKYL